MVSPFSKLEISGVACDWILDAKFIFHYDNILM